MSTEQQTDLRRLEGWLPLAQALNEELGWRAQPHQLEQLVLEAAAALDRATNLAEARAILVWQQAHTKESGS